MQRPRPCPVSNWEKYRCRNHQPKLIALSADTLRRDDTRLPWLGAMQIFAARSACHWQLIPSRRVAR